MILAYIGKRIKTGPVVGYIVSLSYLPFILHMLLDQVFISGLTHAWKVRRGVATAVGGLF
jgi:hypothetical protein